MTSAEEYQRQEQHDAAIAEIVHRNWRYNRGPTDTGLAIAAEAYELGHKDATVEVASLQTYEMG